jgi:hypothetical protein
MVFIQTKKKSRVLYVVCFLLGNSPASEFYMPTFRNTLFHLRRQVHSLNFICRRFGTHCLFHLHRQVHSLNFVRRTQSEFYMPTFRNTLFHLHRQVHSLNFICRTQSEFYMPTFRDTLFHLHRQVHSLNFICRRFETHCSIFIGKNTV